MTAALIICPGVALVLLLAFFAFIGWVESQREEYERNL
jgi:hypothetical protein